MKKQQEPVIRQTAEGPMQEIREQMPWGWYAAGGFCLLYAAVFPLYKLGHFVLLGLLAAAVGLVVQRKTPVRTRLVPYTAPPVVTGNPAADELLAEGAKMLAALQEANAALPDEAVSARLDSIQASCQHIFAYIRQNPGQASQCRKFMNYYLPTLLELVNTLARLEGSTGANIDASRQRITGLLERAAAAFDTFYDQLHADQAMNVNAEISVFDAMLRQEGLAADSGTLQAGH